MRTLVTTIAVAAASLTIAPAAADEPAPATNDDWRGGLPAAYAECRLDLDHWQRRALGLGRIIVSIEREHLIDTLEHRSTIARKNARIDRLLERIDQLR